MLLDRPRIGNHLRRIVTEVFYFARGVRTEMRQILRCNVNVNANRGQTVELTIIRSGKTLPKRISILD